MFALVDCNNFYAACETVFNPALRKQPVVVLSHNDGCVIARSAAAKALGVEMGMPGFQLEARFPHIAIQQFSSNFTLYGSLSARIHSILETVAPSVEVYSIDEAFLDLSGFPYLALLKTLTELRSNIENQVGITVSIGIGPTKTLAKLANRKAKKMPEGLAFIGHVHEAGQAQGSAENPVSAGAMGTEVDNPRVRLNTTLTEDWKDLLASTDIMSVWGIGDQQARVCRAAGIHTALDFTFAPPTWVQKQFAVVGARIQQELQGIACIPLIEAPAPKQSIVIGRSFGQLLSDKADMLEAITTFAHACAAKLRKEKSMALAMQVRLQTQVHRSDLTQVCRQVQWQFPQPLQDSLSISHWARKAVDKLFQPGVFYKKAVVMLLNLQSEQSQQSCLFEINTPQPHKALMQSIDEINRRFGKLQVRPATLSKKPRWALRQFHRSQRYTTRIDELLVVHAK